MPVGGKKISACIVTLNEENNIRDCLQSVKWVDEIVVVDALSSDRTVERCRDYADRIIQRPWPGHVAQKNYAVNAAAHDWVLCIDADERVSQELKEEILRELQDENGACEGFYFPRQTFYLGRWIKHGGWYPDHKLRLFNRSKGLWGGLDPHDRVQLDGRAKFLRSPLYHYTYRSLSHHLALMDQYTNISADQKDRGGLRFPLPYMFLNPIAKFMKTYVIKRGFLDGIPGFVVAVTGSFYVFLKYAKRWEMRRQTAKRMS